MVKAYFDITNNTILNNEYTSILIKGVFNNKDWEIYNIRYHTGQNPYDIHFIIDAVNKTATKNVIIDFVSTEHYVPNNHIELLHNELSDKFNLKILTANLAGNFIHTHSFYPQNGFSILPMYEKLKDSFRYTYENVLYNKQRLKKGLFLNNRARMERFLAIDYFDKNDLLKDMLYSFNETVDESMFILNKELYNEYNIAKKLPITLDASLDVSKSIEIPIKVSYPINFNYTYYFQSYFEIIFETWNKIAPCKVLSLQQEQSINTIVHITEKTLKPLLFGFPFSLYGCSDTKLVYEKYLGLEFNSELYKFNDTYDIDLFCSKVKELIDLDYHSLHEIWYNDNELFKYNENSFKNYLIQLKKAL